MRADMKYILGDRRGSRLAGPRKGKRFSPAEFRKFDWDFDDAPFVAGYVGQALERSLIGRRRWGRGYADKPIARYLSSQVGRLWNDVLSDIREALRKAEIVEAHWPDIVTHHVAVDVVRLDGDLRWSNWRGTYLALSDEYAPPLYVDPDSRRLCRNTSIETRRMRQKRLAAEAARDLASRMRPLSPTKQLHRLSDGNWWEVTLGDARTSDVSNWATADVVLRAGMSNLPRKMLYGRPGVFATSKRQLSAKEMKRHGLI